MYLLLLQIRNQNGLATDKNGTLLQFKKPKAANNFARNQGYEGQPVELGADGFFTVGNSRYKPENVLKHKLDYLK